MPGAGLQEYQTRTREAELEQEIKRLKQVGHIFRGTVCLLFFTASPPPNIPKEGLSGLGCFFLMLLT